MYPVSFSADYVETRSRLTTFFRLILAIPLLVWGLIWWIGIVVVHVISWFALLFTGRFPRGLYNFTASYIRFSGRVLAYVNVMTDVYPPFGGGEESSYPVRVEVGPPREKYGRWRVFLHGPIAVLGLIASYTGFLTLLTIVGSAPLVHWIVIVNDGRARRSLHRISWFYTAWSIRIGAWALLIAQDFPPFLSEWERTAAV